MKKYIESHLRRAEGYKNDLYLAIEECKDCEPEAYFFALYNAFQSSLTVINQMRLNWPDEFVGGIWSRFCLLRTSVQSLYDSMMHAIAVLHSQDFKSDDLPF